MKIVISTLLLLCIMSTSLIALEDTIITQKAMLLFLEIFPQYKSIVEQFESDEHQEDLVATVFKNRDALNSELETLFQSYEITREQFTQLLKKITAGFTAIRMNEQNISSPFMARVLQSSLITPDEQTIIKTHLTQLEDIFGED